MYKDKNYRSLFDASPNFLCIINENGCILEINSVVCEKLGYKREELVGLKFSNLFTSNYKETFTREFFLILKEEIKELESDTLTKRGKVLNMNFSFSLIRNDTGRIDHIIIFGHDLTESKRAAKLLKKERSRLAYILEGTNVGTWEWNVQTGETIFNEYWAEIIGYTLEEISPTTIETWMEFAHPDDLKKSGELLERNFNKELDYYECEARMRHKNGNWVWVLDRGKVASWTNDGKPLLMFGTHKDITERKTVEEALRKSEEMLNNFMDSATDGFTLYDSDLNLIEANQAALNLFPYGIKKTDLIGKNILELSPNLKKSERYTHYKDVIKSANPFFMNDFITDIGGKKRHLSIKAFKVGNGLGIISSDITELKNFEEKLKKAKDIAEKSVAQLNELAVKLELKNIELDESRRKAEQASNTKSEFLANMSHEIRTPMNAVIGFSELLYSITTDEKQKSYVKSIKVAGKSLLTLINDILDLSKVEAGMLELQYEAMSLKVMANEIEQIFKLKLQKKKLEFIIEIDPDLPNVLMLDEVRIRQTLINIVGNSIKFTENGYIKLSIIKEYVGNDNSKADIIIMIEDSGIGIPKSQQKLIFESFRQQDGQSNRKFGGTGLGLSLTKKLVEMMNGTISVESEPGLGSLFTIYLREVDISSVALPINGSIESIDQEMFEFEPAQIIIVDDIRSNRDLVREVLTKVKLEVLEAENGEIAINLAKEIKPDLILMDIRMPVMDGYQATEILKKSPETADIPIIALTASVSSEEVMAIENSGFSGYLPKPVNLNDLFRKLSSFLKTRKNPYTDSELKENTNEEKTKVKSNISMELIELLENETQKKWESVKDDGLFDTIEEFAKDLINIGEKFKVEQVSMFGKELRFRVNSFDINGMNSVMELYPTLVSDLKK